MIRKSWRVWVFGVVVVVILAMLVGVILGANLWIERSAAPFVVERVDEAPVRKAAIVLGARVYGDGTPSEALLDRLQTALELYERGKVEKILVSGDHGRKDYDEVNAMQTWLVERGVSVEDVFLDHAGFRTFDTMERAKRVFLVEEAIICTQAFHLSRSVFLARRAGIDAVGVVADRRNYLRADADRRRERLARARASVDALNPFAGPRHLGEVIPIDGDSRKSHDGKTRHR